MEPAGILLREAAAAPLGRLHMQQHRTAQFPRPRQHVRQLLDVMPVDGAHIGKAHVLKERAVREDGLFQRRFHIVAQLIDLLPGLRVLQRVAVPLLELIVPRLRPQTRQVPREPAHVGVDGHAVVVEKDDQGLAGGTGVVEALIGPSPGQGAVPDQRQKTVIQVL